LPPPNGAGTLQNQLRPAESPAALLQQVSTPRGVDTQMLSSNVLPPPLLAKIAQPSCCWSTTLWSKCRSEE
jgi:hypothetical protein